MMGPDYDEIIPNLYLGNLQSTKDYRFLQLKNIKYVLSLTKNDVHLNPKEYKHIHFSLRDAPYEDLISIFDICYSFTDECLNRGFGILIHCDMGISRSATIVMAYLMKKMRKPLSEVFGFVKRRRPQVNPNFGFQAQLLLFDKMNLNKHADNPYTKLYHKYLMLDETTGEQRFDVKNYVAFLVKEAGPESNYKPPVAYETGCGDGYKCKNNVFQLITRSKRRK